MTGAEILALIQIADAISASAVRLYNRSKEAIPNSDLTDAERAELIARIEKAQTSVPAWE